MPAAQVMRHVAEGAILRLQVRTDGTQIKIEVSPVLRGVVSEPRLMAVTDAVEDVYGFAETTVVSFEDLYAGKLVAALDRQHTRDLFDVRDLLASEGLTDKLREAFVVYILSHNRPMGEVLSGRMKDLAQEFRDGFEGMTKEPVAIEDLIEARRALIDQLIGGMPDRHREFLISFESGAPDWGLLQIPYAKDLAAVLWRQRNLETRTPEQRAALVVSLKEALSHR